VHPLERMRYVARSAGPVDAIVAAEAASTLADVARLDATGLLPACRRLIDHHPTSGLAWWLSARVLAAAEPVAAARAALRLLEADPTPDLLADALPEEATILVVGWPDTVTAALRQRGDLEVLVVDAGGEGAMLVRALGQAGSSASLIPDRGMAAAATVAGVVLIEALAAGPDGLLAAAGSHAVAAVAHQAGVDVWGVLGAGRLLPGPLWLALLERLDGSGAEPWDRDVEVVPATLLSRVIGGYAGGEDNSAPLEVLGRPDCVAVAELLRAAG
jgi:hypothetical protein